MLFVAGIEADASIQYKAIQAHSDFIHNLDNYHQYGFNSALAAPFHLALDTDTRENMLKQSDLLSITTRDSWESHSASEKNRQWYWKQNKLAYFGPQKVLNMISNATLSSSAVEVANNLVSAGLIDRANNNQIDNYFNKYVRKRVIEHFAIDKFIGEVRGEFAKAPGRVGENSSIAIGNASKNEKDRFIAFVKRCISKGKVPDIDPFWAKDNSSTTDGDASDPGFCGHTVFHLTWKQCINVCKKLGYSGPSTGAGTRHVKTPKFNGYTLFKKINRTTKK
jgi:hypothetical protein